MPPASIAGLGLTGVTRVRAIVASGNTEEFDLYVANVIWDGVARPILVLAIDTAPLLVMDLLIGYDLRVRVAVGGLVEIEAIP